METLSTADDYRRAAELYSRVFGYAGSDLGLNANLLSALRKNGGATLGAVDDSGELVGFVYGFEGTDESRARYHYSQAAVVDRRYQGTGIGRRLKTAQREVALGWGQTHMRWTFDPLLVRNAHFNLVTLGAEGIRYERDFYDRPGSDRLVVDWNLSRTDDPHQAYRRAHAPATLAGRPGAVVDADGLGDGACWIAIPSAPSVGADPVADRARLALAEAMNGRILVTCTRIDEATSAYLAVPTTEGETP
ncbi:GNAT family N-acetyltransferase [Microbacterium dextranolyticum]|uniref:GNAT family N-acetyltransferase n=1 Tax=Microbacterium dextranolyticum TaxID=36806 RepID=UPI0022F2E1E3|nr:GNAT family N-acetyltransferase [Microbacterium dextranolyticum]